VIDGEHSQVVGLVNKRQAPILEVGAASSSQDAKHSGLAIAIATTAAGAEGRLAGNDGSAADEGVSPEIIKEPTQV